LFYYYYYYYYYYYPAYQRISWKRTGITFTTTNVTTTDPFALGFYPSQCEPLPLSSSLIDTISSRPVPQKRRLESSSSTSSSKMMRLEEMGEDSEYQHNSYSPMDCPITSRSTSGVDSCCSSNPAIVSSSSSLSSPPPPQKQQPFSFYYNHCPSTAISCSQYQQRGNSTTATTTISHYPSSCPPLPIVEEEEEEECWDDLEKLWFALPASIREGIERKEIPEPCPMRIAMVML